MSAQVANIVALLVLVASATRAAPAAAEVVAPPLPVVAEPQEAAAAAAYELAAKLAQRKSFAAARVEAEKAQALAPSAQRAALLGAIDLELGLTREAFEQLIVAVNLDVELKLADYVFKRLSALPPFAPSDLGVVRFQMTPAEASCTLVASDERFDLTATRTAVGLPAGRQKIRCEAVGHEPSELEVVVLARRVVNVSSQLRAATVVIAPKPTPRPIPRPEDPGGVTREHEPAPDSTLPTILVIGGGVLVGAAVGLHVWSFEAADRANDAAARAFSHPTANADYTTAVDDFELRRALAITGYAAGALALGTGIVLFLTQDDPAVSFVPLIDPHTRGAACALSF